LTPPYPPGILGVLVAGWSSLVARRAHNPKVAGSNPAPAIDGRKRRHGRRIHVWEWSRPRLLARAFCLAR